VRLPAEDPAARAIAAGESLAEMARRMPAFLARVESVDATGSEGLVVRAKGAPALLLAGPESVEQLAGWLERERNLARAIGGIEKVDARWRGRLFVTPTPAPGSSDGRRTPGARTGGASQQGAGERHGEG
jgi:hypothetical protein